MRALLLRLLWRAFGPLPAFVVAGLVFAALHLAKGHVPRLSELIWGFEATATRRNTVQSKISKLRRVLSDAAVVSGSQSGYSLQVDPSAVDATEVFRVAGAARELLDAGNARLASQVCGRALALPARARAALVAAAAWHRDSGGGELATLGDCLLAAMDAAEGPAAVQERLVRYLDDARDHGDAQVEVFALDALAHVAAAAGDIARARQLCDAADRRMETASHFITDVDRTDAHSARSIVAAACG
jgi:hypothetical protein